MATGLNNLIKPFTGDGDVVAWLKKVDLVARLQKVEDVAALIPLYLEGDALALYLEMSPADQQRTEAIQGRLKTAFAEGPFEAYEKLRRVRWSGESVDVYANKIRQLVELAGYRGRGAEITAKMTFVTGFPDEISKELRKMPGAQKFELADLIPIAKVLAGTRPTESGAAVAASQGGTGLSKQRGKISCFECKGPHFLRECEIYRKKQTCFRCQKRGHLARDCLGSQGNEPGEA